MDYEFRKQAYDNLHEANGHLAFRGRHTRLNPEPGLLHEARVEKEIWQGLAIFIRDDRISVSCLG